MSYVWKLCIVSANFYLQGGRDVSNLGNAAGMDGATDGEASRA